MSKLVAISSLPLLLLSTAAQAIPVYWDVNYYTDDVQVGTGYFGYDSDTTVKPASLLTDVPEEYEHYLEASDNMANPYFESSVTREELLSYSVNTTVDDGYWEVHGREVDTSGHWVGPSRTFVDSEWVENIDGYYWLPDVANGVEAGSFACVGSCPYIYGSYNSDWSTQSGAIDSYASNPNFPSSEGNPTDGYNTMIWEDYVSDTEATGSWKVGGLLGGENSEDSFSSYVDYSGKFVATLREAIVPAVPVPATLPLFGLGLLGLGWVARRQKS